MEQQQKTKKKQQQRKKKKQNPKVWPQNVFWVGSEKGLKKENNISTQLLYFQSDNLAKIRQLFISHSFAA